MHSVLYFVGRNARIATVAGIVFAAITTAGAIGWLTAPV